MCLLGETNMKKLQWIVLLGIIAYQPVHTSLPNAVAATVTKEKDKKKGKKR